MARQRVKIRTLSDADRDRLREINQQLREMPRSIPQRSTPVEADPTAPETYVAISPGGGIAARAGLVPGVAECTIYRFDDTVTPAQLQALDFTKSNVYNIFDVEIVEGIYLILQRDKFGAWLVETTSAANVTGEPTSECGCPAAQGTTFYVSGGDIVEAVPGDIEIVDGVTGASNHPQSPMFGHGPPADSLGYPGASYIDIDAPGIYYWQ